MLNKNPPQDREEIYHDEHTIGHRVGAWTVETEPPEWWSDEWSWPTQEYVVIQEADIDWDEQKRMKMTKEQLKEMYEFVFDKNQNGENYICGNKEGRC
jgi:hypothetical protein